VRLAGIAERVGELIDLSTCACTARRPSPGVDGHGRF